MLVPVYTSAFLEIGNTLSRKSLFFPFFYEKRYVQSFEVIGLKIKLNRPPFCFELGLQVSQPCEMQIEGFPCQPNIITLAPGAVNTGLFLNYCVGVEMTGFGYTTAETETSVQVKELELLAKLEVRQV